MQRRLLVFGRNAHKPSDLQTERLTASANEGDCFAKRDTRLLWLFAGIDLHEQFWRPPGAGNFLAENFSEIRAVDAVNHVEERD